MGQNASAVVDCMFANITLSMLEVSVATNLKRSVTFTGNVTLMKGN